MITVYYLDDEVDLCRMFMRLFASERVRVVVFSQPQEAIAAYRAQKPDVFFIDHRLPQTSGDDVASLLIDEVPKILITGDLHPEPVYPFYRIIKKPYPSAEIRELLHELTGVS